MYQKPKDVSYTDMCIYIDTHVYDEFDEHLVFEYLYHLAGMFAKKGKYFIHSQDYDSFAIFAATQLYMRLIDPRQFPSDSGEIKLPRIKSILNYIKTVIYPLKVDFQQEHFSQLIEEEVLPETEYNFNAILSKQISNLDITEFGLTLQDIAKTCEKFLSTIPYDKKSVDWHNIYTSVMLTFLSSITLRNSHIERIEHLASTMRLEDYHYDIFYREARQDIILYHLPEHMKNYIDVLCRQLNHILAKDLCDILNTKVHTDYMLVEHYRTDFIKESMKVDVD